MSSQFVSPLSISKADLEEGSVFAPKFDDNGLITTVVTSFDTGEILMLAYMNEQSLQLTLDTGIAHYWSRSRQRLWKKGETSGNLQTIMEMRTDCDQDALWIKIKVAGDGPTCHTERNSCFYRRVNFGSEPASLSIE